jgi:subtilisin family serine protease
VSSRYLVFVDDNLLFQTGVATARLAKQDDQDADNSLNQVILQRHVRLEGFARAMAGQAGALDQQGRPASVARSILTETMNVPSKLNGAPDGMTVLAGIGAIVVDDGAADLQSIRQLAGIEVLEDVPLYLPTPTVVASSTLPPSDWHLQMVGLSSGNGGGQGITIGVLDTGIDASHGEFSGKRIAFAEFDSLGRNISSTPRDAGGHGTHVCSIAAGRKFGVAPDAELAVAAVLTQRDRAGRMFGGLVQIANGMDWLIVTQFTRGPAGVDIINASLGGAGFNNYLQAATRRAKDVGIGLVAAIGNSGRSGPDNHGSPGNYPEALAVGASDENDTVAEFSDWGDQPPPAGPAYPLPALSAPGVNVHAARAGGGTQPMSGTSMATPVVAGIAARRMAANPALRRRPAALFLDLQSRLAPLTRHADGNKGGAGRIIA